MHILKNLTEAVWNLMFTLMEKVHIDCSVIQVHTATILFFLLNLSAILIYRLVWLIEVNAKGWAAVLAKGTLTNSKITYELFSFIRMKDVTYMNVLLLNWFEYALQWLYKEELLESLSWNHWGCICKILFASCFKEEYCVKSC
jgi:hypothetical protein